MIEIKCTKICYERLIEMAATYFDTESKKCFLGKTFFTCPAYTDRSIECKTCLRRHIKRINAK